MKIELNDKAQGRTAMTPILIAYLGGCVAAACLVGLMEIDEPGAPWWMLLTT